MNPQTAISMGQMVLTIYSCKIYFGLVFILMFTCFKSSTHHKTQICMSMSSARTKTSLSFKIYGMGSENDTKPQTSVSICHIIVLNHGLLFLQPYYCFSVLLVSNIHCCSVRVDVRCFKFSIRHKAQKNIKPLKRCQIPFCMFHPFKLLTLPAYIGHALLCWQLRKTTCNYL